MFGEGCRPELCICICRTQRALYRPLSIIRSSDMGFPHFMFSLSESIFSFVLRNLTFFFSRIKFVSAVDLDLPRRGITYISKWGNQMSLGTMRPGDSQQRLEMNAEEKGKTPLQGSPARILTKRDNLHVHEILPSVPCQAGLRSATAN